MIDALNFGKKMVWIDCLINLYPMLFNISFQKNIELVSEVDS